MKIAFLGAGALGSSLGGVLAAGGSDVTLVDQWAGHVDAINAHGLRLRNGDVDQIVKVNATTDPASVGMADLVVVLVKSFATREAIEAARALVGADTMVLSLQNGLGHEEILADVVGSEHVLAGKTYAGGVQFGPGHVAAGIKGKETVIGELDGSMSLRVQRVADEFNRSGLTTIVSDNIMGIMWDKLLINVATSALTGITRLPYGPLNRVPEVEETAVAAVREAITVAQASGIKLSSENPRDAWVKATAGLPEGFKPSLLASVEKGQRTEIDFINGSVVRWAERCNVPTPVNQTLVACVKGIEYAMAHGGAGVR